MTTLTLRPERVKWGIPIPPDEALDEINERCIELPLGDEVAELGRPGWVLDAGCALLPLVNIAPADRAPIAQVVHLTQNIASEKCVMRGTQGSYVSADLRDLSIFADRAFDRVICLSTLEHVGLDNSHYGGFAENDPKSMWTALRELWRVTGSVLFLSVPFHPTGFCNGRWRYFSDHDVTAMTVACAPCVSERRYYAVGFVHGNHGWYGGYDVPYDTSDAPGTKPDQIVCLKLTR